MFDAVWTASLRSLKTRREVRGTGADLRSRPRPVRPMAGLQADHGRGTGARRGAGSAVMSMWIAGAVLQTQHLFGRALGQPVATPLSAVDVL
jgi:hypothetical protein